MATLSASHRKLLENVIGDARSISEKAARAALEMLAVHHHEYYPTMSDPQRKLRNRLRARARQLGDKRDSSTDKQEITRLVHECAYEHWHRMLFGRFLAENGLLRDPVHNVEISLDDCRDIAREDGVDLWTLVGRYAQGMLPQIFNVSDPVLEVPLAINDQQQLEVKILALPAEIFKASDSLGWVYQFWQSKKKEEVNASGNKIGADELPSVTQLFTEDYMVDFLLDNTLGAWHAGKYLIANAGLADTAKSEEELRKAIALPGSPWKYLRFIKDKNDKWTPAAGTFDGWPKTAKELKCLDPCMGSGHFVVAMFERLVGLRLAEEKLDEAAAVAAVIRDNLFGLEIDPRCTQIGAFNLALAAWRRVGHRPLPAMNLACSGLAPNAKREEWLKLTEDAPNLRFQMGALYDLFGKAPILGSLLNPRADKAIIYGEQLNELQPLLEIALAQERKDDAVHELAVTARGLAKAAEILSGQFTLVATNVPYLGRLKQNEVLRNYCERVFPESKADLATCFVERCSAFCSSGGSTALVTPQNWLFLGTFIRLRESFLKSKSWNAVVQLGEEAWWSFGMRGPRTVLLVLSEVMPQASNYFFGIDVSTNRAEQPILLEDKAARLADSLPATIKRVSQQAQFENPDATIVFEPASGVTLLSNFADSFQGAGLADIVKYRRLFWEIERCGNDWVLHQSSPDGASHFSGMHFAVYWQDGRGDLVEEPEVTIRGRNAWKKRGIACAWLGSLPTGLYLGTLYDNSAAAIIPKDPNHISAVWCFCSSSSYLHEVRKINHKPQVANAALVKVPFDLAHWQKVAAEKYPQGLPKPFSSDPTQWLFNGHPTGADQPLHVAVARLLGYQWPRQTGSSFPDCPALGPDGLEQFSDEDGIVCISAIQGENAAPDRLLKLLSSVYKTEWSNAKLQELLKAVEYSGETLESWLRNGFFEQHCKIFHQRPFIFQIWDGHPSGFSVLVNYHKLVAPKGEGRRTLEKLIYTYLGEWIKRQKADQASGVEGADAKLAAAMHLKGELEKIRSGEPPFDIFIRWKPLHQQSIGWEPDINDGVRFNIRPFINAKPLNARGASTCILRVTPKIKWEKDRGKEPTRLKEDFPWFWDGNTFKGDRVNDLHFTTAEKEAARKKHQAKTGGKG